MNWLCFVVSPTYCRKGKDAVLSEIRQIFDDDDLVDIRFVEAEEEWASEGDYCFLKCNRYEHYIASLKQSAAIVGVLPSYESPEYLSDDDVSSYYGHLDNGRTDRLFRGDIVIVTGGYLTGLIGIVKRLVGQNVYQVVFRFYIRCFEELLPIDRLLFLDNLFRHVKMPVTETEPEETGQFPVAELSNLELCAKTRVFSEVPWGPNRSG